LAAIVRIQETGEGWLMRSAVIACFTIAAACALSAPARAQLVDFSAYGGGSASTGISFVLPRDPVPDFVPRNAIYFRLYNITYDQGSFSGCPCTGTFTFYINSGIRKGGVLTPIGYFSGPQLFSGPLSSPMFLLGNFTVKYHNSASFYDGAIGSLSITAATVPEPATWALLLIGFAAIGYRIARRTGPTMACAGE
jgi:hypothetical protein